ncbi:hypothetical protein UT300003_10220 [Clostridium sardiniense]
MDIELKEKVRIFIELNNEFKKNLRWDGKDLNCLASLIANGCDEEINETRIKDIRKYIRKNTKFNSKFRGEFKKVFSILMNGRKDYKEVFLNTKYINSSLVDRGFKDNKETLYTAFLLSKRFNGEELEEKLNRLFEIKEVINEEKYDFFMKEDYIVYVYLTAIDKEINEIVQDIKNIDSKIGKINLKEVKSLDSFYLSLLITNSDIEKKIEKVLNIRCNLIDSYNFIEEDVYPLLGLASSFVREDEVFAKGVCGIYDMLKEKKDFNSKGISEKNIFKISLCIVLMRYLEYIKGDIIDVDTEEEDDLIYIIEEYIAFSIIL